MSPRLRELGQSAITAARQWQHRLSRAGQARVALACGSAILCRWSVEPGAPWLAVLLAWTALIVAIEGLKWTHAALLGLVHGVVSNALGFYWLFGGFHRVLGFTVPGAALACLGLVVLQGARSALLSAAYALGRRRGWSPVLLFPAALVACELVYPSVFPWYTAHFALAVESWPQLAEYGGPLLLSAWIATVNAGFAAAWLERGRGWLHVGCCLSGSAAIVGAVTVAGQLRLNTIEQRVQRAPSARIGLVQGNLGPARKETRDPVAVYRHESAELLKREPQLDLLIWPETAIYFRMPTASAAAFLRDSVWHGSEANAEPLAVPLLTGMSLRDEAKPASACASGKCSQISVTPLSNSAVLTSRSGRLLGKYDKRQLMPVGESSLLPAWFPGQEAATEAFRPGTSDSALLLGSHRLGISICYEDILPRSFRAAVASSEPDLLVNLTSDSWFRNSPASRLHLMLARLRAIEHRRFLVRATSTGTSALVAPSGRVTWQLPVDRLASGALSVRWLREQTVYQKLGDLPWCVSVVCLLAMLCFGRSRGELALGRSRGELHGEGL